MLLVRPAALLAAVVLLGCSDGVTPHGLRVVDDRSLTLVTSCARQATARVTETEDSIRIDDVSGESIDGDCLGGATIALDEPLGDRSVIVDGDTWYRRSSDCPYGEFGPESQSTDTGPCRRIP